MASGGYQPERLPATISIFFYTVCSSFFLFANLLFLIKLSPSLYILSLDIRFIKTLSSLRMALIISAFLVKAPIYGLHL